MNINHLKLFVRVTKTHNISMAGRALGLSPAVASAQLNKLEDDLGVRLLHRSTRKVSLTEEGRAFLPHAQEVLHGVEAAEASVGRGKVLPKGTLRVTAPASFGRLHLIPVLKDFLTRYPDLTVDLQLTDTIVDLVEGGFDIAIRNANLQDSTLIGRKLAPDTRIICCSPAYLEKHGEPKTPYDLQNHQCVILAGLENWVFDSPEGQIPIKSSGRLRVDHGEAMRDGCLAGMGIALVSTWIVHEQLQRGEIVQILQNYPYVSNAAIWAVYPSSRLLAPKVRRFIDYLADCYGNPPYWDYQLQNLP
ncbi:MAG: LysR family transcriptional regulator [Desulfobulbaceae bacterium]|nr:MAG: LysR family transcriptional regulator [Desulfobulbaceae bacterium]